MTTPVVSSIKVERMLVTPATAAQWMELNFRNRRAKPGIVQKYALLMLRGHWSLSPDAIGFYASDGALENGQQRLAAVRLSETSQYFLVVWGLPEDSRAGTDVGSRRNAHDLFVLEGLSNDRSVPAACCDVLILRRVWDGSMASFSDPRAYPNIFDQVALGAKENLTEAVVVGKAMQRAKPRIGVALAAALYYEMGRATSSAVAQEFFDLLRKGDRFRGERDPAYKLREQLIENKDARRKMGKQDMAARVIKAFNYCQEGVEIDQLRWAENEGFPFFGQQPGEWARRKLQRPQDVPV